MAERLLSLDAFRGLTVAAMVLVNNPGTWRAVYPPLQHAEWHGLTPTDLVFPSFLFIVGVAIPFALGRRRERGEPAASLTLKIVRRAAIIFLLGLVLHGVPDFELATLRIPGVLQRIALCYLAAALLFLGTGWRGQVLVAAAALLGYWAAMTLVAVPGFGAGDLGREGNLAAYLDRLVLGPHIWRAGRVYDPEGLLSTVPALGTTLIGVLTGHWLRAGRAPERTVGMMAAAGAATTVLGAVWGIWFPINKALWTSSYALLTAGMALLTLSACAWLIELRGYRRWAGPFMVFGVNALAVFFLSSLLARMLVLVTVGWRDGRAIALQAWLFDRLFAPWASPVNASLAYAVVYVLLWLGLMWPLYVKGVRWRL